MLFGSSHLNCLENLKPKKGELRTIVLRKLKRVPHLSSAVCPRDPVSGSQTVGIFDRNRRPLLDGLEATKRNGSAGSLTAVSHESEHIHSIATVLEKKIIHETHRASRHGDSFQDAKTRTVDLEVNRTRMCERTRGRNWKQSQTRIRGMTRLRMEMGRRSRLSLCMRILRKRVSKNRDRLGIQSPRRD
jgi:hypothetical protein